MISLIALIITKEILELKMIYYPQKSPQLSANSNQPLISFNLHRVNLTSYNTSPPSLHFQFSILNFQFNTHFGTRSIYYPQKSHQLSANSHQPIISLNLHRVNLTSISTHSFRSILHFPFSIPPAFLTIKLISYLS